MNFKDINDVNTLKIALYYFTDRVLNGRKDEYIPNPLLLNNVDELECFRSLSCLSWGTVYESLDTILNQKLDAN